MADLTPNEKRWTVIYGEYAGLEHQALLELHRGFSLYINYVLPVRGAHEVDLETWKPLGSMERRYQPPVEHAVVIGTAASNRVIADLLARKVIPVPTGAQ